MYRRLLKMLVTAKAQQDIPGLTRTCTESPPSHNLAHFSPCAQETYGQLLNPAWAANILTLKSVPHVDPICSAAHNKQVWGIIQPSSCPVPISCGLNYS